MSRSAATRPWCVRSTILIVLLTIGSASASHHPTQPPDAATPPAAQSASAPAAATSASSVIEEIVTRLVFQDDGTGIRTYKVRALVRDEGGIAHWGTLGFPYMAAFEDVRLERLIVRKPDGREIHVRDARLEDVTQSGQVDEPLISDVRIKRVTVPALQPGDRVLYKVAITQRASQIPGHFWADHWFTRGMVALDELLEVDVPAHRPIRVAVKRGAEERVAEMPSGRRVYRWRHRQPEIAPATGDTADAEDLAAMAIPDVRLSSFESWDQLSDWLQRAYDQKAVPDAAVRAKALELVAPHGSPRARIEALFDFVSDHVRYVSLSFGTGRLEPRPSGLVLSTQYGDCKDKHTLLASLASAIGLRVHPVFISSTTHVDERVPSPSQFDHVISVVDLSGGGAERLWMDATSGLVPPGTLFSTLRGRLALFAGPASAGPRLVRTPNVTSVPNSVDVDVEWTLSADARQTVRVRRRAQGEIGFLLRMALRTLTREQLLEVAREQAKDDEFKGTVGDAGYRDLGRDQGVEFWYEGQSGFSPAALAKPWRYWIATPKMGMPEASVLREARIRELDDTYRVRLRAVAHVPPGMTASPPVPVKLAREFGQYVSTYRVEPGRLTIERELTTRLAKVAPDATDAYESFLRALDADYRQTFAVDAIAVETTGDTADGLAERGADAITRGDTTAAIELLERAVSADTSHPTAWTNLGRAYLAGGRADEARRALQRQIDLNPFDEYAYTHLGRVFWEQGRYAEAAQQFQRQIEVVPLDRWAHANLGMLHRETGNHAEAEVSLARAVSITPEDAELWQLLGSTRLELGRQDEALKAFEQAASHGASASVLNAMAWELVERGVALDAARRYARSAVDSIATVLRGATLATMDATHRQASATLAPAWDTLGWILFKAGDPGAAEPYLAAAWALGQHPEVAGHLATLAESQGKRDRAIRFYALGCAAAGPKSSACGALERLSGAARTPALLETARQELVDARVVPLPAKVMRSGQTIVLLRVAADGTVLDVHSENPELQVALRAVKGVRIPAAAPDADAPPLIRQAMVSCGGANCSLLLLSMDTMPSSGTR